MPNTRVPEPADGRGSVPEPDRAPRRPGARTGRCAAWLTVLAASAAWFAALVLPGAPARSGPNCTSGDCVTYPYTDAAAFVPNDFLWMVPAFLLGPLLVVLLICLLHGVTGARRPPARTAVALATASASVLCVDYYVQFTTVQASLVRGETGGGLSLLSQYNPHGVFIALEDVGYLSMLVAFVFAARALDGRPGPARILRQVLAVTGTIGAVAFVLLIALLGRDLEYWFEITGLCLVWAACLPVGALAAAVLRSPLPPSP